MDPDNHRGSSSAAVVDCELSERNGKDPATPEADRLLFGWLKYRPKQLQGFLSPKWALFWLCWAGAIQGVIVNGLINVSITTIERRYDLRSSQFAPVASAYDFASFCVLIPLTYFGGRATSSKPRWIGCGVLLMAIGSLIFAMPHFLAGPYRAVSGELDVCQASGQETTATVAGNSTLQQRHESHAVAEEYSWTVYLFVLAQLFHGAGAAPLFTLGVTYIDENVSKKMSSIYLGIYYSVTVIGPAVGYVVGGQLLQLYTDMSVDPLSMGLTPQSNVWVGAWWIGFLAMSVLNIFIGLAFLGFPAQLPGAEDLKLERVSEAHGGVEGGKGSGPEIKPFTKVEELPTALMSLMKNLPLTFLNLAGATEGLVVAGFAAFLPKVVENQFSVTPIWAALLMGLITVPAGGGGTFLGGYLVKKWNLSYVGIVKLCLAVTTVAVLLTGSLLLKCPNINFAGVTAPYTGLEMQLPSLSPLLPVNKSNPLESTCNQNCGCSKFYNPVCGINNILYYNPCYAGCKYEQSEGSSKIYLDCSCITVIPGLGQELPHFDAINTMCDNTCSNLYLFTGLCFLLMLFTFLATMPALAATLRCVHDDQKSFALGVQWLKVRVLGTIPAPLIFAKLIDEACLYWKANEGDEGSGSCLVYNKTDMSKYMFLLAFVGKLCSVIFFLAAWLFYIPPKTAETVPAESKGNIHEVISTQHQDDEEKF